MSPATVCTSAHYAEPTERRPMSTAGPANALGRWGRRGLWLLDRVADTLALTGLVATVLVVSWQVFGRYVLQDSPRWAPETALVLMGWLGFLGIAIGLREGSHIAVGYIADKFPARVRSVVEKLGPFLMLLFGLYLIVQGWSFTQLMSQNTMPGTGLSRSWQYAAMPVSGMLVSLYALLLLLGVSIKQVVGTDGPDDDKPDEVEGSAS